MDIKVAEKQNEAPTVALKEENVPAKEENTAQVEIKNPPVVKEKAELAQKAAAKTEQKQINV